MNVGKIHQLTTFEDIPGKPTEYPEVCRIGVEAARELAKLLDEMAEACERAQHGDRLHSADLRRFQVEAGRFADIVRPVPLK